MSYVKMWGKGRKGKSLAAQRPSCFQAIHGQLSGLILSAGVTPAKLAETLHKG